MVALCPFNLFFETSLDSLYLIWVGFDLVHLGSRLLYGVLHWVG